MFLGWLMHFVQICCQIKWENRLIIVGGQTKNISDRVTGLFPWKVTHTLWWLNLMLSKLFLVVRFINLDSHLCGVIETTGDIPVTNQLFFPDIITIIPWGFVLVYLFDYFSLHWPLNKIETGSSIFLTCGNLQFFHNTWKW